MTEIRTVSTLIAKREEIERSIANYEVRLARLERMFPLFGEHGPGVTG